ncbi:MAG TPA: helix-turn-helix transcriptional regulator [Sphingomonas sp.]
MTLKEWRDEAGVSQMEAARMFGWSQSTLQRIEAGAQPADARQLRELHTHTGGKVTPNDMVLG